MSNDSNRGMGPTSQNPQAETWGGGDRPTVNPEAINDAIQIINTPAANQPSAAIQSISAMLGNR